MYIISQAELIGELRFAFIDPCVQIQYVVEHSFAVFDKRQHPGVPHLTNRPYRAAPVFGRKGMVVILSNNDAALIEVFKQGADVTGSRDNFILWLNQKSMPLGGKTPLKLLLSNKAQQVLDELVRIEHGICV